jgi:hypothetical protein
VSVTRASRSRASGKVNYPTFWTRPTDWLPLPTLTEGVDEKIVLLAAVFPNGNSAFAVTVSGAYTVDWGDGTVTNYASGAKAERTYSFASLPANTTTSEGWRQAVVTITPQAGQQLNTVLLNSVPTGMTSGGTVHWRDIAICCRNLISAVISTSSTMRNGTYQLTWVGPTSMNGQFGDACREAVNLRRIVGTKWTATLSGMFRCFTNDPALEFVDTFDTTNCTTFAELFSNCTALRSVPLFNSSKVTNFSNMFASCVNLREAPAFDTSAAISTVNMFAGCWNLSYVPTYNLLKVTQAGGMFSSCLIMTEFPAMDMPLNTSCSGMFQECRSLRVPPTITTPSVTDFGTMFVNCVSLLVGPTMDTSKGVNFGTMFQACQNMRTIPAYDMSSATSTNNMFINCSGLTDVPPLNTSRVANFTGMFQGCFALRTVSIDMSSCPNTTATTLMFNAAASLTSVILTGLKYGFPSTSPFFQNNNLSAAALNALYTSLGIASGAQTLAVAGNYGTAGDDPTIATAKGWTVTGS